MMVKQIKVNGQLHSFPDDATEEEINATLGVSKQPSFGHKALDYEKGLFTQLAQSAANGGYHAGMLPSYAYEAISGHPLYSLIKPDISGYIPESEAGQTGQHVGESVADIASLMLPGRLAQKGLRAILKYKPLTKGQMSRQIQGPIGAAEEAGIKRPLGNNQLYELNDLLSHSALEPRGAAGRGITPLGRHAQVQEAAEGKIPGLHSAQSLLGDLERVLPELGESPLIRTRIRPLKEHILEQIMQGMKEGGLPEEAENYQTAREAARRHFRTKKAIKKIAKPMSLAALAKLVFSGAKNLP